MIQGDVCNFHRQGSLVKPLTRTKPPTRVNKHIRHDRGTAVAIISMQNKCRGKWAGVDNQKQWKGSVIYEMAKVRSGPSGAVGT